MLLARSARDSTAAADGCTAVDHYTGASSCSGRAIGTLTWEAEGRADTASSHTIPEPPRGARSGGHCGALARRRRLRASLMMTLRQQMGEGSSSADAGCRESCGRGRGSRYGTMNTACKGAAGLRGVSKPRHWDRISIVVYMHAASMRRRSVGW